MKLGAIVRFTLAVGLQAGGAIVGTRLYTTWRYGTDIYTPDEAPTRRVALVFGAGLTRDGRPTAVLYDRVAAAVELYRAGKVDKLLMSGDNRFVEYNEPAAMRQTAIELGVPAEDIVLDSSNFIEGSKSGALTGAGSAASPLAGTRSVQSATAASLKAIQVIHKTASSEAA